MRLQQLKQIQRAIESFFYKIRFNIAFYNLLHHPIYYNFRQKIEDALYKQILYFAKIEKINTIIGFEKAVKELTDKDLLKKLRKIWIPILAIIKETDFNSYLLWAANKGGQIGLDKLKIDQEFKLKDEKLLKELKDHIKESIKLIDQTTQDWIARTIEQGLKNNLSHFEIAKLLRDEAKRTAEQRADLITEQEAILTLGEIEIEVYKKNNIKYHKWITSRDELVCVDCMANEEAGEVKVGEVFPSGVLSAPAHFRCRCMVIPTIPKELKIIWTG